MKMVSVAVFALAIANAVDAFQPPARRVAPSHLYSTPPKLDNWKVLPEGKIRGIISGHPTIPDGDTITTSALLDPEQVTGDKLVVTNSGSEYMLLQPKGTQVIQKVRGTRQIKGTQKIGHKPTVTADFGNSAVAVPILGGILVALGTSVGFDNFGEKFSSLTEMAKVKVLDQMPKSTETAQTPYFAAPYKYKVELPYLQDKVSEAEKENQAAERKFLAQQVAAAKKEADAAAAEKAALQAKLSAEKALADASSKFEEAQAVAAEKLSLENKALAEKAAWDKVVLEKALAEKAEEEMVIAEEIAAAKASAESKIDEAREAIARAQVAREAVEELKAEEASALLAEESAEAEEQYAEQEMISAMKDVELKAADFEKVAGTIPGAPVVNQIISGKINPTNAFASLFNGPSFRELWKRNSPGVTASLITVGVAAVGFVSRYREDKENQLFDEVTLPGTSTNGSYLDALMPTGSSVKAGSYSPFGNYKTSTSSSNSLYSPPAAESTAKKEARGAPIETNVVAKPPAAKKVVKRIVKKVVAKKIPKTIKKETQVEATNLPSQATSAGVAPNKPEEPIAEKQTAYGSYLENLGGSGTTSVKSSSYSPFGNAFKTASSSSYASLYAPPASLTEPAQTSESTGKAATSAVPDVEPEAPPAAYGSYLEILSGSASGSVKASSYSPFGNTLTAASSSSSDSLYSPPASFDMPESNGTAETKANGVKAQQAGITSDDSSSYLEAVSGAAPSSKSELYSPFGSIKLTNTASSPSSSMSYSPPTSAVKGSSSAQIVVEDRIRTAYSEWCNYFGKKVEMPRLEIFASNFKIAEEFYKTSGTALMLNEYADLTEEEYTSLPIFQ